MTTTTTKPGELLHDSGGYAAGVEAAAKTCEAQADEARSREYSYASALLNRAAAAIRALPVPGQTPTPDHSNLSALLEAAKGYAMTDEGLVAQRESWVRGEKAMGESAVFHRPAPEEGRWREKHCDEGCPIYTDMERKGAALLLSLQAAEARALAADAEVKRLREAIRTAASALADFSHGDTVAESVVNGIGLRLVAALSTAPQPDEPRPSDNG